MRKFLDMFKGSGQGREAPSPGIYAHRETIDGKNVRLHLRVREDGEGLLVVNASSMLHLNKTATEYAHLYVNQTSVEDVISHITGRYRQVSAAQAERDYLNFDETIKQILFTEDLDPTLTFGIEREELYSKNLSEPLRLDCALTYRLSDPAPSTGVLAKRVERELTTAEWVAIIDGAWAAGIPHIVFTGGEPTLRDDLPDLIDRAERNGQVTGLMTDGRRLSNSDYLKALLTSGLDHTVIILSVDDQASWEGIASFNYWRKVLEEDLFVAAHLTITQENADSYQQIISRLEDAGVSALSLSTDKQFLAPNLTNARDFATGRGLEIVWDLPVPYSALNPVELESASDPDSGYLSGAGRGWLYVEPDGDVLPGQGISHRLGNLINDKWDKVIAAANKYLAGS